ncbi:N4 gp42-like protein [Alteromonas alvinellae]
MQQVTNNSNLPLSIAVWLAHDDYDHDSRENHISATSLLKPLKQLILSNRVDNEAKDDIVGLIPSAMGSSIHNGIEAAWVGSYAKNLEKLGYPKRVIERIRVNPSAEDLKADPDIIPIYLEVRSEKEIDGFIISGKFDFIGDGRLEDFKTTSVYTFMKGTKDEDYINQGSIYRWLNPDKVTRDDMAIQFIFTDWQGSRTREPNYPNMRTVEKKFMLNSYQATEAFVRKQLATIKKYWDKPESEIPECNDDDLWRKPTVYKVYKDEKAKRAMSGGVFDEDKRGAERFAREKGAIVKTFPGEVVACRYCKAFEICEQKQKYLDSGELQLRG